MQAGNQRRVPQAGGSLCRRVWGADREKAIATCVKEANNLLGVKTLKGLTRSERQAWERWSPLVTLLPGIKQWGARDKKALVSLINAKGSQREVDYLYQLDNHKRLREALGELAYMLLDD